MVTYINVIISHTTMEETPTNNTDVEEVDSPVCVCCISLLIFFCLFNLVVQHLMYAVPTFIFEGIIYGSSIKAVFYHLKKTFTIIRYSTKAQAAAILTRRYSPKFLSWNLSGMKQAHLESMWELDCGVLLQGKGLWHPLK